MIFVFHAYKVNPDNLTEIKPVEKYFENASINFSKHENSQFGFLTTYVRNLETNENFEFDIQDYKDNINDLYTLLDCIKNSLLGFSVEPTKRFNKWNLQVAVNPDTILNDYNNFRKRMGRNPMDIKSEYLPRYCDVVY